MVMLEVVVRVVAMSIVMVGVVVIAPERVVGDVIIS